MAEYWFILSNRNIENSWESLVSRLLSLGPKNKANNYNSANLLNYLHWGNRVCICVYRSVYSQISPATRNNFPHFVKTGKHSPYHYKHLDIFKYPKNVKALQSFTGKKQWMSHCHPKWENICKSIRTMSDTQQMLTIISVIKRIQTPICQASSGIWIIICL